MLEQYTDCEISNSSNNLKVLQYWMVILISIKTHVSVKKYKAQVVQKPLQKIQLKHNLENKLQLTCEEKIFSLTKSIHAVEFR